MLILAFDTTSEMGGVGIFRDTECLASIPNAGQANQYSITLFEMVEQALASAHRELREIDLYAAANGPGSFTGIRVGLAAARAWGKAFDRRVRGVSVLEAMVNKACQPLNQEALPSPGGEGARRRRAGEGCLSSQRSPTPDWFFPILDARRGSFSWAASAGDFPNPRASRRLIMNRRMEVGCSSRKRCAHGWKSESQAVRAPRAWRARMTRPPLICARVCPLH